MAKSTHPGKREALEKYKRLYLAYLESDKYDVSKHREDLIEFETFVLANTDLGITSKTLGRAKDDALEERKRGLHHANA